MMAADARNAGAVQRVLSLKNRPAQVQMSVAFRSIDMVWEWTRKNTAAEILASAFLPGPLTLILHIRTDKPKLHVIQGNKLGIRLPGFPPLLDLLEGVPFPVTATSANRHGESEPYTISQCARGADYYWDYGTLSHLQPSTIVDLTQDQPQIMREGAVLESDIFRTINKIP
jgi:L-threonylcarbamoyladenylate synthase